LAKKRNVVRLNASMMNAAPKERKNVSRVLRQNFRKYRPTASELVAMTPRRNPSIMVWSFPTSVTRKDQPVKQQKHSHRGGTQSPRIEIHVRKHHKIRKHQCV